MRLQDQTRKCVVFLGHPTDSDATLEAVATGFVIEHGKAFYLVTAAHVAMREFHDAPLGIRLNDKQGNGRVHRIEEPRWFTHPTDPSVDVAVLRYEVPEWADYDAWITKWFVTQFKRETKNIGAGDLAYIVGLYRLVPGVERITPIVHTGHIAMMEDGEPILAPDWRSASAPHLPTSAYLVEAQTLDGLSGSPVFVRRSLFTNVSIPELDPNPLKAWLHGTLWFVGLWRSAWFGPADSNKFGPGHTHSQKVPTGMGIVVPATQIIEVLEHAFATP